MAFFNWPFLLVIALLVGFGLLVCWSAVYGDEKYSFTRQLAGVGVGVVLMVLLWHFDYRRLANMTTALLVINVVLILSPHLPVIGVEAKGAQSWINIGMQVQPGEFAKVTVVLFAASLLARYQGTLDDWREYCKALGMLLIPFACIMTQPDLGTGLVYLAISAVIMVMAGAKGRYLLITVVAGIAAIAAVFALDELLKYQQSDGTWEYRLLKNYQRSRLLVFLNPEGDLSGDGYNLAQAKIAIGSGGLFGKGLLNATQSTHGFLPEAPTDFIFCVLAEEMGFAGVVVLIALYGALIAICLSIARGADDLFGMLIVMGVIGMWLFQILENIGMDVGLMPITGIPLPFVSYGSSFMVVNFALIGLIGSVWSHRSTQGRKAA
ncbi:rod shape-determining protein RodA [Adlercreutzia sp. R21]|uniref:Rod shape-determining protein RodA n=1 Tax=Adlercreutzia wanghongyangiae TaxID=3111451 RepID=A0ABU6IGD5_9ACTN|nr:rod shape-determining protein RodA [Adlercreutzia sp. R21]MEC4175460.1 rod shape-determining protein RodA [Adlercreutzia sp. R7]MEC4183313.1 rod shape-determining protein RodA [Adlercreutzia sp. R21]